MNRIKSEWHEGKQDRHKSKVMVHESTNMGTRQIGIRKVHKDDDKEFVIVNGRKRGFDWMSYKSVLI